MGRKSRVYVRRRRPPDSANGGSVDLAGGLALEEVRTSRRLIEDAAGSTAATAWPGDERRRKPRIGATSSMGEKVGAGAFGNRRRELLEGPVGCLEPGLGSDSGSAAPTDSGRVGCNGYWWSGPKPPCCWLSWMMDRGARRGEQTPLAARRLRRSSTSHGHRHRHRLPPRRPRAADVAARAGAPAARPRSRLRPFPPARALCRPARPRPLPRGPRARRGLHHRRRPGPPPEGSGLVA
jgi:hypothetical protein